MGKEMTLVEPALVDMEWPPTEDELPCDDGVPMETQRHVLQLDLLMYPLLLLWVDRQDIFVGGNMFVYFSLEQVRNRDFRGPDFFVVLGVPKREHKSWVVWQEGKGPDLVIELLSESTAALDKGEKKQIYQDQLRVPEYFWFDPFSGEWAGFALRGRVYEPIEPDAQDRLISLGLGLALVCWKGTYEGISAHWLRWATLEGDLLPTPQEVAEEAKRQAEEAHRQEKQAQQEAAELKALLARYRERFGELPA